MAGLVPTMCARAGSAQQLGPAHCRALQWAYKCCALFARAHIVGTSPAMGLTNYANYNPYLPTVSVDESWKKPIGGKFMDI